MKEENMVGSTSWMTSISPKLKIPTFVRQEPLLFVLGFFAAVLFALFSIIRHEHFQSTGFDLGIFDQTVWQFSHFQLGKSTLTGLNSQLGDHFSPVLFVLAPLYWVFPSPNTLLIAQAVLVSSAIFPIFLFARDRVGRTGAYLFSLAYLCFWGVHSGIGFDFHELAFAPAAIAWMIYFIDQKRWLGYFISVAVILLIKEDLAIFVFFVGIYLLLFRKHRYAIITSVAGLMWFFLATKLLIPSLSGGGNYLFWTYSNIGPDLPHAVVNAIKHPDLILRLLTDSSQKGNTLLRIFGPFLFLPVFSPLILLCVPLIVERMLSTESKYWLPFAQYQLAIAPLLAMGAAAGLKNIIGIFRAQSIKQWVIPVVGVLIIVANVVAARHYPISYLFKSDFYNSAPANGALRKAVSIIPAGASVAAENYIVPHLSERKGIYLLCDQTPDVQYLVADVSVVTQPAWPPGARPARELIQARSKKYRLVFERDGIAVYKHKEPLPPITVSGRCAGLNG